MAGAPRSVVVDRDRIIDRSKLGVAHRVAVTRRPWIVEEDTVGGLGRTLKPAQERVDEDDGAALDDRRSVAPEPRREPQPHVGSRDRVGALPWEPRRRWWDADHERVEWLVEYCSFQHGGPKERLGVGHRRCACVDGGHGELAWNALEHPLAHPSGCELKEPADVCAEHTVDRVLVVRVPGERAR